MSHPTTSSYFRERRKADRRYRSHFWQIVLASAIGVGFVLTLWLGTVLGHSEAKSPIAGTRVEYWDAKGCQNPDGSTYDATADKLSEFPGTTVCKEYVHHYLR
jgi:hypothetical protein